VFNLVDGDNLSRKDEKTDGATFGRALHLVFGAAERWP